MPIYRLVLGAYGLLRERWGKFELRYLDPNGRIDPKKEKRATVLRLLQGTNTVRVSLRPRTAINVIPRLAFSAFHNRRYPTRLMPGVTGERLETNGRVCYEVKVAPRW